MFFLEARNIVKYFILPKASIVLIVVIVMLKFRFPPKKTVHIFEAPPAGLIPVKKRPNCRAAELGKSHLPSPKLT